MSIFDACLETYLSTTLNMPVWAGHVPQGVTTYPALVYQEIYALPFYTLDASAGFVESGYQIDIYGDDLASVEQAGETLRSSLEGYRGLMGTVYVSGCRYDNSDTTYEGNPASSDQGYFRIMTEWRVFHAETVPSF